MHPLSRRLPALTVAFATLASTLLSAPAARATASHVVISELATRGPSSAFDEFVELYNPTSSPVSLSGWRVQYKSSSGSTWGDRATLPAVTIAAHGFFLVASQGYVTGPTPDYTSSQWPGTLGIADNGNMRIIDGSAVEVDKLGWGSTNDPEGAAAPNHGTTANGNSIERKALATSTADSLAAGGAHALLGNGQDTDNNSADFVVQTHGRNPQNSTNAPEPGFSAGGNGTGRAAIAPAVVFAGRDLDSLRVFLGQDSAYTLARVAITVPATWTWSHSTGSVLLAGSAFQSATPSVVGDTLFVDGAALSATDSGNVTITGTTTPASKGSALFTVRTAIESGTLTQITPLPSVRVLELVPIVTIHVNDASGVCAAPYAVGSEATVSGVVTANLSDTRTDVYVQDVTGGIDLFNSSLAPITLQPGDSITVTGSILQFRGLTEIQPDFTLLTRHATGRPVPDPLVLNCADVNATFHPDFTEPNEGRLIRINGVTYNATTSTITDATGTTNIFIPNTYPPTPTVFDIIGILKQFKPGTPAPGPPYTADYEITPRTPADILADAGPLFLTTPYEDTIQPTSVHIHWTTDVASSSIVRYGLTTALGDSVTDATPVTVHDVTLSGLTAATVYHYSAGSGDVSGTNFAPQNLFSTASPPQATGTVNVYFNKSVDTAIAWFHAALGNQDLTSLLKARIDNAHRSIDAALYSLSGTPGTTLANALIAAKNRGLKVRVICEYDNSNTSAFNSLIANGIPFITDRFDTINNGAGLMHNKFLVLDGRGGAPDSVWVWTGSWNPTDPGTNSDFQNSIELQDPALAGAYSLEFDEMWGSTTDTPNASASRFGARKLDDTPHHFVIGGRKIECYFSPSDGTNGKILSTINAAQHSVGFQLLTLTRSDLANALVARQSAGVPVRGDLDNDSDTGSEYSTLISGGVDVGLKTGVSGLLHHKYAIFDAESPTWDAVTLTGSHNWSSAAENSNNENTLIVHDFDIANQYEQEFRARYHQFGGSDPINVSVETMGPAALRQVFLGPSMPNPARDVAAIDYAIPAAENVSLALFDVQGRQLQSLVNQHQAAGRYRVRLSAKSLPNGVYFYRLRVGRSVTQRKMLHLQ